MGNGGWNVEDAQRWRTPGHFESGLDGIELWRTWGVASENEPHGLGWKIVVGFVEGEMTPDQGGDLPGLVILNASLEYGDDGQAVGSAGVVGTISHDSAKIDTMQALQLLADQLLGYCGESLYDTARRALTAQAAAMDVSLDIPMNGPDPEVEIRWPPVGLDPEDEGSTVMSTGEDETDDSSIEEPS